MMEENIGVGFYVGKIFEGLEREHQASQQVHPGRPLIFPGQSGQEKGFGLWIRKLN